MTSCRSPSVDPGYLKSTRRFLAWAVLLAVILVVARETIGGQTVLLRQAPEWVRIASYALGLGVGLALARTIWMLRDSVRRSGATTLFVAMTMVPLAVVTTAYLARWAFELTAFAGGVPASQKIELKITDVGSGKSGPKAYLMSSENDREVDVKITSELYSELAAIRPPLWSLPFNSEPYCITLHAEFGRWGALRARVPAHWEAGLHEYHACNASVRRFGANSA
jgi:hypothetical protein